MSVVSIPTTATLVNINTTTPQTVLLPLAQGKIGRVLTITDSTGQANINNILISTQATNYFQSGGNLYGLSTAYQSLTFLTNSQTTWSFVGSTAPITYSSTITNTTSVSVNAGLQIAGYISSSLITSILNTLQTNPVLNAITVLSLNSTIQGLGTLGYGSTIYINQTSNYFKNYTIFDTSTSITSTNLSSVKGLISLIALGSIPVSTVYVGQNFNQNALKFWSKTDYNNTVIAEQSTGNTTSELVVFKGSSISDQLRFQTTGRMVFEVGASTRNFTTASAFNTATMTITANSNVGIMTNNPIYTLDVAGTGRFQTLLSTPNLYAGALSLGVFFA